MKKDSAILTFDDIDAFFLQKYIDYLNGCNVNNKHITAVQQLDRIKRISELSNQVLKKVSKILKLKNIITMKISKRAFVEHSLSNRISLEMITQSLGSSIETVFKYSINSRQPIFNTISDQTKHRNYPMLSKVPVSCFKVTTTQ